MLVLFCWKRSEAILLWLCRLWEWLFFPLFKFFRREQGFLCAELEYFL